MTISKKLILIVDDNPENIKFIGNLLVDNGYEVGIAQDGFKAMEFIGKKIPALILLDIMMPEMNGFQLCEKLKYDKKTKDIPIIFLTAKNSPEDIVKGFEVGGMDYVTKPFNSPELLARIKTHVQLNILKTLLPVCSSCTKIRDDEGEWLDAASYISKNTGTKFSHTLCPVCLKMLYPGIADQIPEE